MFNSEQLNTLPFRALSIFATESDWISSRLLYGTRLSGKEHEAKAAELRLAFMGGFSLLDEDPL